MPSCVEASTSRGWCGVTGLGGVGAGVVGELMAVVVVVGPRDLRASKSKDRRTSGFILCLSAWILRWSLRAKRFPQKHPYGFSPVCVRRWRVNLSEREKDLVHTSHTCLLPGSWPPEVVPEPVPPLLPPPAVPVPPETALGAVTAGGVTLGVLGAGLGGSGAVGRFTSEGLVSAGTVRAVGAGRGSTGAGANGAAIGYVLNT